MIAAVDAYERLELDKLIFIPTANQPLKQDKPAIAPAEDRLQMVRLLVANDARFEVSETEIERGGLSYTVDTLEELARKYEGAELILVLGMDSLATFSRWVRPERIKELARFGVLTRTTVSKDKLEKETGSEMPDGATLVTARRIDVSSSEIRQRIRAGKSIKGFAAESVEEFIRSAQLYTS